MKKILLFLLYISVFSLQLRAQTDNCVGATVLSASQLSCAETGNNLTGNTNDNTTAGGINFGCIDGTAEIGEWYQFTAVGADIEIINNGANPAPYIAIVSACPTGPGDIVYCDQLDVLDMDGEGDDLLVTGTVYYLWVGFDGSTGPYNICLTNLIAPVNDECVNATNISGQLNCIKGMSASVAGTTIGASPDGFISSCITSGAPTNFEGVWYTFTAQGKDLIIDYGISASPPTILIVDACPNPAAPVLEMFCGTAPVNLTDVNNGDNLEFVIGQQYWVWVGFDGGLETDFELCFENPEPPINDDCPNAIDITADIHCILDGGAAVVGDICGAQPDLQVPSGSCLPYAVNGWEGIWYTFTTEGHDLIIESGGNEDPYIVLYSDCPSNGGTPIICAQTPFDLGDMNDVVDPFIPPTINNSINNDYINTQVWMWVGFDQGIDSTFTLCIENPMPPQNDQCAMALAVEAVQCIDGDTPIPGSTQYSSFYDFVYVWDPADSDFILNGCFDPNPPNGDEVVWYNFTAPGVDLEITDLMGNNPSFMIFNDNNCGMLTTDDIIICDEMPYTWENEDDLDDLFNVGDNYVMVVAFPGGWMATDSFELCINIPTPPPNDLCENAQVIEPDELDCPDIPRPVFGYTTNGSQDGTFWTNIDPLVDLPCMLDTTEDDGVWYRFTAIGTDIEIQDELGNDPTILLMNYTACPEDTVSVIFCEQTPIGADFGEPGNNALVTGNDYLMYVTFQGGETMSDTFELCIDNEGMCSSPSPPNSYCQTTPICGLSALDAFCLVMQPQATNEPWPGCGVTLHDPNWFSFVAGSDNLIIQVNVGGCSGSGVHMEMYEIDCTVDLGPDQPFCPASDLNGMNIANCQYAEAPDAPFGNNSIITFDVPTEFGNIYGIVIDGWGGDLCNIEIDVVAGADPPSFDGVELPEPEWDDDSFPFLSDTICVGAEQVPFELAEEVDGACRYNWTINGMEVDMPTNDLIEYFDFPNPGTFIICVNAGNFCDQTEDVCDTVYVIELETEIHIDTICEGDLYTWISYTEGIPLTFDPPFTSEEGGDYVYNAMATSLAGCVITAELYLHVLEENDDNPTPIDTVICSSDAPLEIFGNVVPIGPTGEILDFELDEQLAHDGQCDSFFIVDAYSLDAIIFYDVFPPPLDQPHVNCQDSMITVCPLQVAGNPFFLPDPNIYPDVEIHYTWLTVPFGDTVGSDNICLEVSFDDFDNITDQGQEFEVVVTMTKGGRPAGGCIFGPFELELVLPYFIPDVEILGPDTVCIGPEYNYEITPFIADDGEVWPAPDGFAWDLSGFPGAMRTEVDQFNSTFAFSQLTTGQICVTALHPCSPSPKRCKTVVVSGPPVPVAGDDAEECTNDYQLSAGNPVGTWYTHDGPFGAPDPVFSDINDPNATVTISVKGEYTFGWITEGFGCFDTSYVDIDFIEPMSMVGDVVYTCDNVNENFTAEFTFEGGIPPYVVTSGNGTLNGMDFTSDLITSGDTAIVLITDAQNCTGSFLVTFDCECLTVGGEMNTASIESCGEACVQITPFTAPMPDPNDIVIFVLHTSPTDVLGTVIAENTTGEFCLTNGGPIAYDVQYYVSVVVGNDVGGTVDLTDRCAQIAPGQPVIWYEIPSPDAGMDAATCDDNYALNVMNSNYGGEWQVITSETNVTFSDPISPTTTVTALGCGVAQLRWIETNEICSDTTNITIEFYCNPTATPPVPSCNMDQTELSFTFMLNGVGPFIELNGRGRITGNDFVLDGLTPPTAVDMLTFEDANGCQVEVTLPEADCNCLPLLVGDTICGLNTTITSDGTGNGGSWSIDPSNTGPGTITIATPNSRTTDISVTEYGVYTLGWTENGNLCDGYGTIDLHFVNSPVIDVNSIMYQCNANYDGYVITFDIVDGHPASYQIVDNDGMVIGQIVGNTFTSNEIPSTLGININLSDGFMCDIYMDSLGYDCGCFTGIGSLDDTPLNLCREDQTSVIYDDTNETPDGNDVRHYILYSDVNDPLNSIIAENPSGVFSFVEPPMMIGLTYYISAVLGTENTAIPGLANYMDPCLTISNPLAVTWYEATVPSITQSEAEFTCLITNMNLGVTASGDISEYDIEWTTTNGSIEPGDENSQNPQINSPGTYTVTLTHSIAGCPSSTFITIDQSDEVPDANIVQPLLLTCDRLQVTLSGQGSSTGSTIRYEWSGPGIVGANNTLDIIVDAIGEYTLTVFDDANSCMISTTIMVGEDVIPPDVQASVAERLDCNTIRVAVSGEGSSEGGIFTYSWTTTNGNIIGSVTDRDIIVDEAGVYEIEVTNTSNGCVSRRIVEVENDPSVIQGATIDIMQIGCDGLPDGQIFVDVDGGTAPFMYSFDGGATFGSEPILTDVAAGVYEIVITDANGCEHREFVTLVQPIDFTVDLGETILVDFGDTAYLTALTNLPDSLIMSVTWNPTYDSLNPTSLTQQFVPDLGQQEVSITMVNLNGCVEQDNVIVVARFAERIYIPTAMNPNSPNAENQRIYIFANPESVAAIHSFSIYNRWGERMFQRGAIEPSLSIDPDNAWNGTWQGEDAPAGVYVYYADVEFITGVQKIIKGEFTLTR